MLYVSVVCILCICCVNGNPSYVELAEKANRWLFNAITANPTHVLSKYLPNLKTTGHNFRPMGRRYELPENDNLNFMSRILYSALSNYHSEQSHNNIIIYPYANP